MFRLDGVIQSVRTIQSHYWESRESFVPDVIDDESSWCRVKENGDLETSTITCHARNAFHAEVLSRLSCLQIACIAVDTLVTQTLRGVTKVIGGIITFEGKVILDGVIDLISIPVQAVILPIMAFASILFPKEADWLGTKIIKHVHIGRITFIDSTCSQGTLGIILGIISIPLSGLRSALRVPIKCLDGSLIETLSALICVVKEPIASVGRLFTSNYYQKLSQYEPTAFENISTKAFWCMLGV